MKNELLENLSRKLELSINKLNEKREKIGFYELIDKNNDISSNLKKIYDSIEKDKTLKENYDIKKQIDDLKLEKEKNSKKLESIKKTELDVFKIQSNLEKKVYKLDKEFNQLKVKEIKNNKEILSIENNIQEINQDNNKNTILGKKLIELEEQIEEINNQIKEKKNKKEKYIYFIFELNHLNSERKKINKKINKISNLDLDEEKEKLSSLKILSDELQEQIKYKKLEIDNYLELIDKSKHSLEIKEDKSKKYSFEIEDLNIYYGNKKAISNVDIKIPKNKVISIIGPSGCGKSTFLRTLNRINDSIPNFKCYGKIIFDGKYDIQKLRSIKNRYDRIELTTLRTRVGMIFQHPNPFSMSIFKNVSYGPKINGISNKIILNDIVKESLENAALWDEVKNNLKAQGTSLSGGQQQRLCIARAIANKPQVLLMDEPTSALDPIASKKIEELILKLKEDYTIILVTHSMQQAQRISDYTAFFYEGKLIEFDETDKIFNNPTQKRTKEYIDGKFG